MFVLYENRRGFQMGVFGCNPRNDREEIIIDSSNIKVEVIVSFKKEGGELLLPLYFRYENPDSSRQTFKVERLLFYRNLHYCYDYHCIINNRGYSKEVILAMYDNKFWYLRSY
jgi:hypothetical protein